MQVGEFGPPCVGPLGDAIAIEPMNAHPISISIPIHICRFKHNTKLFTIKNKIKIIIFFFKMIILS